MGQVLGSGGLPEPGRLAEDLEKAVDTAMRRLAGVVPLEPGATVVDFWETGRLPEGRGS